MLAISRDNREEIENEFLALLLNKNELFDITQIKPQYLSDKHNAKIFEYCQECYNEHKVVNPVKILEKHKDMNMIKFGDLLTETFYYDNAWKEQMKVAEECIVKYYKEDIVNILNRKIERKEISYDMFMKRMKELDDIELVKGSTTISVEELSENISTDAVEIKLNKFS